MQKTYLTIEEQVRLCFPKATKEEQQRIAAEWKAKARRMAKEPVSIGLMQFKGANGQWKAIEPLCTRSTTATRH